MTIHSDILKSVPLFAELPEDSISLLTGCVQEVSLEQGSQLFAEGDEGDKAYVVMAGEMEVIKASAGREVLLNVLHAGDVVGEMALLEHQPRMASVRARSDSRLLAIGQADLEHLLATSLPATRALFYTMLRRWRQTDALLRQSEKMAQLGTLTAGVAHELNNPASAVQRGAEQLAPLLEQYAEAHARFTSLSLGPRQREILERLEQRAKDQSPDEMNFDSLELSDRTEELETWLMDRNMEDAWDVAPSLAGLNVTTDDLADLGAGLDDDSLAAAVRWLWALYEVHRLLDEIATGASRVSDIVGALKGYSYLDQAPVQNLDVHQGIESTLVMLRHKLKQGVEVRREYDDSLPAIVGYGSELNQVWTNLIDNAIDAMEGTGTLTIRTRREGDWAIVEIEDTGSGIQPEHIPRLFELFFTTKPQGKGTGIGLNTAYNIVVQKHRGDIQVTSEPGKTCFQVWLPFNFEAPQSRNGQS